jgi:hypothetical protein
VLPGGLDHGGVEQRILRGEVVVERARGDTGFLGDLLDRNRLDAAPARDDLARRL